MMITPTRERSVVKRHIDDDMMMKFFVRTKIVYGKRYKRRNCEMLRFGCLGRIIMVSIVLGSWNI